VPPAPPGVVARSLTPAGAGCRAPLGLPGCPRVALRRSRLRRASTGGGPGRRTRGGPGGRRGGRSRARGRRGVPASPGSLRARGCGARRAARLPRAAARVPRRRCGRRGARPARVSRSSPRSEGPGRRSWTASCDISGRGRSHILRRSHMRGRLIRGPYGRLIRGPYGRLIRGPHTTRCSPSCRGAGPGPGR